MSDYCLNGPFPLSCSPLLAYAILLHSGIFPITISGSVLTHSLAVRQEMEDPLGCGGHITLPPYIAGALNPDPCLKPVCVTG